ncbi:MAG TPA: DUF3180 domain-containing protein [Streptosporangiaceae bacterium]|jgi:hypothetical protein
MTQTPIRWLAGTAVVVALLTWPLLRHSYATLPPLPWTLVPTLALLAIAEAVAGRTLRARISGREAGGRNSAEPYRPDFGSAAARRAKRLDPEAMVRTLALARASAYAAAVVAGVAAGFLIYLASTLTRSMPHTDLFAALGIFVAAVLLTMAAVYLERSCRLPDGPADGAHAV